MNANVERGTTFDFPNQIDVIHHQTGELGKCQSFKFYDRPRSPYLRLPLGVDISQDFGLLIFFADKISKL